MSLCPAISGWALAHWLNHHAALQCATPVSHFLHSAWNNYSADHR